MANNSEWMRKEKKDFIFRQSLEIISNKNNKDKYYPFLENRNDGIFHGSSTLHYANIIISSLIWQRNKLNLMKSVK